MTQDNTHTDDIDKHFTPFQIIVRNHLHQTTTFVKYTAAMFDILHVFM